MFDAGFWELLVIGVLALVVVGPERLPRLARTVGLWVGRARHAFYSVRDEIEREANAEGLRDTERAIRESMKDTEQSVRRGMAETEKEITPEVSSSASGQGTTAEEPTPSDRAGAASGKAQPDANSAAGEDESRHG